jgi:hypothetical protein
LAYFKRENTDGHVCGGCYCVFWIPQTYLKLFESLWSSANMAMCLKGPKYWENPMTVSPIFRAFGHACRCLQGSTLCFLDLLNLFEGFCAHLVFRKHLHVPQRSKILRKPKWQPHHILSI